MLNLLFMGLMLLSCGYSASAGGRDGRCVSGLFAFAWMLSLPGVVLEIVGTRAREAIDAYLFVLDLGLLAGLWLVVRSTRSYWPVWILGLHVVNLSTDVLVLTLNGLHPIVTYLLHAFWSLPELILMPFGVHLDNRRRRI